MSRPVKDIPQTIEERIIRLQQLNETKQTLYRHSLDIIEEGYRTRNSLKQILERLFINKLGITEWGLEKALKIKILKLYIRKLETAPYVKDAPALAFTELVREDAAEMTELQEVLARINVDKQGETKERGEGKRKRKKRTRKRKKSKRKKSRRCKGKRCKKARQGTKKRSHKRRR